MTVPRTTSGAKYHQIGQDAYAVVIGDERAEISERHPGHLWAAFTAPNRVQLLFMDDLGSGTSTFDVIHDARAARIAFVVDGDQVAHMSQRMHVRARDSVRMNWGDMFDEMA